MILTRDLKAQNPKNLNFSFLSATQSELDPVGSTVRYEVMKLIIDVTGPVEGIYAFILNKVEIWSGVMDARLTDRL